MLIAAAVCPHPPLLIPEVAQGAATELASLRAACARAVTALRAAHPTELVVVGAGARTHTHPGDAGGSLAGHGPQVTVGAAPWVLPLSLTVGGWLLERVGRRPDAYVEVAADLAPPDCARLGERLAHRTDRLALLVMGDGSARRTEHAPGYLDPRATDHDTAVAVALEKADTAALARLDVDLAAALLVAGRPAWQVLAGAAGGTAVRGELYEHTAPYGVGYFVAAWRAR